MFALIIFLATFGVFFLMSKMKGASLPDSLHRAAVAAIVVTLLSFIVLTGFSYIGA